MFNEFKLSLAAVLACLMLAACTDHSSESNDPKQRLTEYISHSFSVKSMNDRKDLLDFLTGEAKLRLAAWSDEQFEQAFIDSKRQFLKLAFTEVKTTSPREINITYEISYLSKGKGHDAKVTNKKLCQMIQEDGHWMIADVRNIKELVEYQNEMDLP